jgi:hypothetical protein
MGSEPNRDDFDRLEEGSAFEKRYAHDYESGQVVTSACKFNKSTLQYKVTLRIGDTTVSETYTDKEKALCRWKELKVKHDLTE